MKVKEDIADVGVIVGRFQVPELHQGHVELVQHVCEKHDKVVILLGLSPIKATMRNPLDFEARRQMLNRAFPNVNILYIKDMAHDERWSEQLDSIVEDVLTPHQTAVLYGGRDSFIEHYTGKHPCEELETEHIFSGEVIRKEVSRKSTRVTSDFRAGVIWATTNRFPTVYTCVDIGIFNDDYSKLLLGKKPYEIAWRLPGGFTTPGSPSFEADARREAKEETGLDITDPVYVGNFPIPDWRYRNEVDEIRTVLFKAKKLSGHMKAADDLAEAKWFDTDTLADSDIMPNHRELVQALLHSVGHDNHSQR
jgi:bifunctional NMN adenylyltransferase/nudix hydrolase